MIDDDILVIDGVVHAFNLAPENLATESAERLASLTVEVPRRFMPAGEDRWVLDKSRYERCMDPRVLGHALFAESPIDACIYHEVGLKWMFPGSWSPLSVGKAMRELWPGRVKLVGFISPMSPNAVEEVDRLVDEEGVVSLKFYPVQFVDGRRAGWRMDDPEVSYPIFRAGDRQGLALGGRAQGGAARTRADRPHTASATSGALPRPSPS